ncbi:MAG: hypothetical protein QM831_39520 [Kofleriaceae bacterium]
MNASIHFARPRIGATIITFLCGALLPIIGFVIAAELHWSVLGLALAGAATSAWLLLVIRSLRLRLDGDRAGLGVANLWRSHRVPWTHVAALRIDAAPFLWQNRQNFMLMVFVVRRDGRSIAASGTLSAETDLAALLQTLAPLERLATTHDVPVSVSPIDAALRTRLMNRVALVDNLATVAKIANRV